MIISEIHIDGFGLFNGFSSKNLKNGVNILLGDNEVGKSTLLKFLRFTLFGYPRFKEQRMSPLFGGNHGGRIKAILSTNKVAIFERKGDNQIALSYDGNISSNETLWLQLLGNTTQDIYENVFAFSLAELIDMDSLSVSGVADKIFSIGAGLNISIGEVLNDIQGGVDQIYSPRGSKQTIPSVLKVIQEKKSSLKAIQENLPKYQELTTEIQGLAKEIYEIEEDLKKARIEKEENENYLKSYESFVSVVRIDDELAKLPAPQDYPKSGLEDLNGLEEEQKKLSNKIDELQKGSTEYKGIEEIEETLKSISFNNEILNEKIKVNHLKTNLEKYKQAVIDKSEAVQKINSLNTSIKEQLKDINSDWIEQNVVDFSNLLLHQDRVKETKKMLDSIKEEKLELEGQKKALLANESRINSKNALILISLVFLLASIPAFYYSLYIVSIVCIIVALMIFLSRKHLIKESHVEKITKQLLEVNNKEKEIRDSYEDYLEKELDLKRTLSIDSIADILKMVAQTKREIIERDDLDKKQKETKDLFINGFENEVKSLSNLLKDKAPENEIETLVSQIIEQFDNSEKESDKENDLKETLSSRKKELERNKESLTKNNQSILVLLKKIDASDQNDFRGKYELNDKAKDLIEKRSNAINTIETIVGINMAADVIEFLKTHDQLGLREGIINLESKISSLTDGLNSKNKELGEKKGEIRRIEGESELAERMTELEIERQKLTDAYKDWIIGKIALKLLTEERGKYEKEKQPVIIKNSSKYFDKITSGKYKRINVSLDKSEITIFDSREASKNIDQLSRGTKEQLLISLRLGFIEEYETKAEPLPVIVDEVLVNFDPTRAKKTAEIFQDFGKNRQIIIFTCHPSMVEYFDKSSINLIEI